MVWFSEDRETVWVETWMPEDASSGAAVTVISPVAPGMLLRMTTSIVLLMSLPVYLSMEDSLFTVRDSLGTMRISGSFSIVYSTPSVTASKEAPIGECEYGSVELTVTPKSMFSYAFWFLIMAAVILAGS